MAVEIKRLTENELELLMNWRMREDIAKNMFSQPKLTLEGQYQWFDKIKNDTSQIRWIVFVEGIPIGSIYLFDIDYTHKRAELGHFIAEKSFRSIQLDMSLMQNLFDYVFYELNLNKVYALYLEHNKRVGELLKMYGMDEEGCFKQHALIDDSFTDVYAVGLTKYTWESKKAKNIYKYEKYKFE